MQKERAFRITILLLSFGSIAALSTFLIKRLPLLLLIPILLVALTVCIVEIARRCRKIVGIGAALVYAIFMLLPLYVAYMPTIMLAIAMLSFPFLWEVELRGESLRRSFSNLGIRGNGFWKNAILGVATTVFVIGPLILTEAAIVISWLHLEEAGKVPMIVSGLPLYILIFSFTISPVAEEIFFRGFLLEKLPMGIILSTLLFTFAHYSYGSLVEFLAAFTAGLIFAIICRRSKSLIPSIFAHAAFNFINVALVYSHVVK
jgi:membrane protease YdiL (CAAX protease family)